MSNQILIEQTAGEIRAALLENDKLVQFQVQPAHRSELVGNIYRGIVRSVKPSLDAAFIDIGLGKNAFLPGRDLPPSYHEGKGRKALQEVLKSGHTLLVQVLREAVGDKGAMVTGSIVLPGRYLVLAANSQRSGVSRKLSDKERERLRKILKKVTLPSGAGVIVRTAGEGRNQQELEKDLTYLLRLWKAIQTAADKGKGPQLLFREGSLSVRFVREFMTPNVTHIRTNSERIHQELTAFVKVFAPRRRKLVVLADGAEPLFRRYGVEAQVERLFHSKVPLPSGGYIVIDHTEALVAIDVNTGRSKGSNPEESILKANLEAADEIGRQVVLRDIGGLIVVDFVDMESNRNRTKVEKELRQAFSLDKARIRFGKISPFGMMELSRQQLRPKLQHIMHVPCPRCGGSGVIKSSYKAGSEVLMRIRNALLKDGVGRVVVEAAPDEARYLLNERRREIVEIEDSTGGSIEILPNEDIPLEQAQIGERPPKERPESSYSSKDDFVLSMYSLDDIESIGGIANRPAEKAKGKTASEKSEAATPSSDSPVTAKSGERGTEAKKGRRRRRSKKSSDLDKKQAGRSTTASQVTQAESAAASDSSSRSRTRKDQQSADKSSESHPRSATQPDASSSHEQPSASSKAKPEDSAQGSDAPSRRERARKSRRGGRKRSSASGTSGSSGSSRSEGSPGNLDRNQSTSNSGESTAGKHENR